MATGCKETLCLSWRLEPAHDFISSPPRPVTSFDPVVKALVGSVIDTLSLLSDRPDVAAQGVGNDALWLAELSDQPYQKSLGGFAIAACLRMPSVSPLPSTARQSQCFTPLIGSTTPSRCQLSFGRSRFRRMQAAQCAPNRLSQRRMASRLTMTPRSTNRPSTSAVLSAKRW